MKQSSANRSMKFFLTLFSLFLLSTCKESRLVQAQANVLPNILLFLVDDLGKEWIGCYGAEDIQTPNIDALARSGMLFHNVYSMPQCTPTRVTLLTGQYPFRHGWVNHWDVPRWGGGAHFDETVNPSLVKELKAAGYRTAIAGKWQIDDFRVEPDALLRNGYDAYCMWTGYESGNPASAERYHDPYIFTKEGSRTYEGKFGPDVFRDFITNFIRADRAQPMFIYYPMVLTHPPLVNTPDESANEPLEKHKAMVRYTDKITGEIVKALEVAGIRENTLIIWTTDNGTSRGIEGTLSGRKISGGKGQTSEPGISAPFIASWPAQIRPHQACHALIDFTDILPTCLDIAGTAPTKEARDRSDGEKIDGKSFKDALLGNCQMSQREWIMAMGGGNNARLTDQGVENQYRFRDRVLRNQRYKLYIDSNREPEKFFDLKEDPWESVNLIDSLDDSIRRTNYLQLLQALKSFPQQDNDPRYRPNPDQQWDVEVTAESEVWKK